MLPRRIMQRVCRMTSVALVRSVKYNMKDFYLNLSSTSKYFLWVLRAYFVSWLWTSLLILTVVISRRQKRVQLMRIREKDAKKRQQAGGQDGTYRRKPTPVKRYAGDLLAPVSVTQHDVCCRWWLLCFNGINCAHEQSQNTSTHCISSLFSSRETALFLFLSHISPLSSS